MRPVLDFINDNAIIRRLVLLAAIVMTWRVTAWGVQIGWHWLNLPVPLRPSGVELAAVVAAVTAPLTLFTGSVFKAYVEGRAQ